MRQPWAASLGTVAIVLGLFATAVYGTELTRQWVLVSASPAAESAPPAECPADELAEENLSLAECRQLVGNVRDQSISAPEWFAGVMAALTAIGALAALGSAIAGAGLVSDRPWANGAAGTLFAVLAAVDGSMFTAAVNAGPILRDVYLADSLLWFTLHLMLVVAVLAGGRGAAAPAGAGAEPPVALTEQRVERPFPRAAAYSHLLIAVSVLFLFVSSWWMLALPLPSEVFTYRAFPFQLHKNVGITLLFLVALMLYLRLRRPPAPPASRMLSHRVHRLAVADHVALYVLMLIAAASGYLSSSFSGWGTTLWWLVELPYWGWEDEELNVFWSDVHLWSCWALLAVLAAHVGGALYHAFRNDGYVRRMLRP